MKLYKYLIILFAVFLFSDCKKESELAASYQEVVQGQWTVDRGFHLPPGTPEFYVQYQVEISQHTWHQLDLEEAFPYLIIADTLYLNEFGYIKKFHIEQLSSSSFKLVFTNFDYPTTPVDTYMGIKN